MIEISRGSPRSSVDTFSSSFIWRGVTSNSLGINHRYVDPNCYWIVSGLFKVLPSSNLPLAAVNQRAHLQSSSLRPSPSLWHSLYRSPLAQGVPQGSATSHNTPQHAGTSAASPRSWESYNLAQIRTCWVQTWSEAECSPVSSDQYCTMSYYRSTNPSAVTSIALCPIIEALTRQQWPVLRYVLL